jgi:hypothetical protein
MTDQGGPKISGSGSPALPNFVSSAENHAPSVVDTKMNLDIELEEVEGESVPSRKGMKTLMINNDKVAIGAKPRSCQEKLLTLSFTNKDNFIEFYYE